MKIATRVVIDIKTMRVKSVDEFDYHGPLCLCDSAGAGEDNEVDEGNIDFEPSLSDFNTNITGIDPGDRDTGYGGGDAEMDDLTYDTQDAGGGDAETSLTDNEPKKSPEPETPMTERKSALKKKAKRRSLLGDSRGDVYKRSIMGS